MNIPYYLSDKLTQIEIHSLDQLLAKDCFIVFGELRAIYPSLTYHALYDIYCIINKLQKENLSTQIQQSLVKQYKLKPPVHPKLELQLINYYLDIAYKQAQLASKDNEIPIGAVIVYKDKIIGYGYNQTKTNNNILEHAELVAIKQAMINLNTHRLNDCDLYVTIEPCLMCSGAIIHSRVRRVIFGASEPKTGAFCSQYRVFGSNNSHCQVIGPIDNKKYALTLQQFFNR